MDKNIEIVFSKRKTVAVEIKPDLRIIVRAPEKMNAKEIEAFVNSHADWIDKHLELMKKRCSDEGREEILPGFTAEEISSLKRDALEYFPKKVGFFAKQMGVVCSKITIRSQKTVWGSCSSKKNLNFNCLLMLCPEEIRDYVIIHELCHLIEMNHSAKFWKLVSEFCPNNKEYRAWLRKNGSKLTKRLK